MSEPEEQTTKTRSPGGAVLEIALWALIIGAVLYTVVWRDDMPLRLVATAHIVLTLIVAVAVVVLDEKLFETLVLIVILTVMTWLVLPGYYDYSVRSTVGEAVRAGKALSEALDRGGPKPVAQLGVAIPQETVSRVSIDSKDSFRLTLVEPPLAGKELSFTASSAKGARGWRCSSREINPRYLPLACRD